MPVRKLGKLPAKTIEVEYELEYGRDALAMHEDAIDPGQRGLIVDDGTMGATLRLVEQCGGVVVGLGVPDRAGLPPWSGEAELSGDIPNRVRVGGEP